MGNEQINGEDNGEVSDTKTTLSILRPGGLNKLEEMHENFMLTPITPRFLSGNIFDSIDQEEKVVPDAKGFLPDYCIRQILLMFNPKDLVPLFQVCKTIYQISSTNSWWKCYYENYFKEEKEEEDGEMEGQVNWKKQFFKRYYFLTDCFYRSRFAKYEGSDLREVKPLEVHLIAVGNSEEPGKVDLVKFIEEEFGGKYEDVPRIPICDHEKGEKFSVKISNRIEHVKPEDGRGIFLCFRLDDEKSFNASKKMYEKMKEHGFLDKFSLCLLVGITEKEKVREVGYDEASKYAESENLLGYIECDSEEKENYFLCFGILLDGMLRREKRRMVGKKRVRFKVFVKTLM